MSAPVIELSVHHKAHRALMDKAEAVIAAHGLAKARLAASTFLPWRRRLHVFLSKNAADPTTFFHLPPGRVVELGT